MDVSKFNLFGVLFNFKDKKARDDHAALAETVGVHGEDIQGLQAPTFSEPAANANVREAVAKVKSGATLGTLFTNVKAALNGLITLGEMRNYLVNNGTVTETGKYFLDAAYGKTLLDQITALNGDNGKFEEFTTDRGMYRKWDNGYLEQVYDSRITISIPSKYNNLYQTTHGLLWPIEFKSISTAVCCKAHWGTGASWGTIMDYNNVNVSIRIFE